MSWWGSEYCRYRHQKVVVKECDFLILGLSGGEHESVNVEFIDGRGYVEVGVYIGIGELKVNLVGKLILAGQSKIDKVVVVESPIEVRVGRTDIGVLELYGSRSKLEDLVNARPKTIKMDKKTEEYLYEENNVGEGLEKQFEKVIRCREEKIELIEARREAVGDNGTVVYIK